MVTPLEPHGFFIDPEKKNEYMIINFKATPGWKKILCNNVTGKSLNIDSILNIIESNRKMSFENNLRLIQLLGMNMLDAKDSNNFMVDNAVDYPAILDNPILKAIKFIENNICKKISVKDLAFLCCMSTDYFSRVFKQSMGITPLKFILFTKCEQAKKLLFQGITIEEIAWKLNFSSSSHFL